MKKELIQEVQNYFTEKLIAGEYEIEKLTRHTIHLIIDGYNFTFWIANDFLGFRQYSEYNHSNFLQLEFSEAEEKAVWETLTPKMEEVKKGQWRAERLKKLNEIKAELGLN